MKVDYKKIKKLIYFLEEFKEDIDFIDIDFEHILSDFDDSKGHLKAKYEENLKKRIYSLYFDDNYDLDIDEEHLETSCIECLIHIFSKITSVHLTKDEIVFLIPMAEKSFFSFRDLVYIHTMQEPLKRRYFKNDNFKLLSNIRNDFFKEKFTDFSDIFNSNEFQYTAGTSKKTQKENDYFDYLEAKKTLIEKWLKEFEIGKELSYGYNEETETFFLKIDDKSLLEYGLGFGLIIQILMSIDNRANDKYFEKDNKEIYFPPTYIIEEPETGLHPAFQSKIAEMLVDLQKTFNVNLIIETHSEYLIRKLQYLTATNEINPGDAVIYYFNNPKKIPENEEQIKKITIDKNGSLSDSFGPGFIDEGTNLKFEILRLNRDRQN